MASLSPQKKLALAIATANQAHIDAVDKGGQPYILHPIRVMLSMSPSDTTGRIVAVLHDVVEDNPEHYTLDEMRAWFGDHVADALDALTRRTYKIDDTGGFGTSILPDGTLYNSTADFPSQSREWQPPKEQYMQFVGRVAQNPIACRVKLMDIADNMRPERHHSDIEGLNGRYERARRFLTDALLEYNDMATLDFLVYTKMINLDEQIKRLEKLQKA